MSQPPSPPPPQEVIPNSLWYSVMTTSPILTPQGQRAAGIVGMYGTLAEASQHAAKLPGSAIVMNLILHVNPVVAVAPKAG